MLGVATKIPCQWQITDALRLRTQIVAELDAVIDSNGVEARLAKALGMIVSLERESDTLSQLRRFLCIVAALSHHARWGGLTARQCTQLLQIGEALLKTNGVEPTTSSLSQLWGELHLANSQVQKQEGDAWNAAWQQHFSFFMSRRTPVGNASFQALSRALRAFRLGYFDVAEPGFVQAEASDLPGRNRGQARLCRIQILRLSGRTEEAMKLCNDETTTMILGEEFAVELFWERAACLAQLSGNLAPMMALLGRNGSHRRAAYLLEASLWTRAVQSRRFEEQIPAAESIRKSCRDDINSCDTMKAFFTSVQQVENCYDNVRPLGLRLTGLGHIIGSSSLLPSIDKELLLLAASFRWLIRSKQHGFATLVLARYHAISRVVSSGKHIDALGIMGDIDCARYLSPTFDLE